MPAACAERLRGFLSRQGLGEWITWRADELVMMTDFLPLWGISRRGFGEYFRHGTGHHVGFRYHDPGFGIGPGVEVPLAAGMIITVEPGIYGTSLGGGARIEDNILITETGHEILSSAPRGLNGEEFG